MKKRARFAIMRACRADGIQRTSDGRHLVDLERSNVVAVCGAGVTTWWTTLRSLFRLPAPNTPLTCAKCAAWLKRARAEKRR